MGVNAVSNGTDDTDPQPGFESPVVTTEPLITFNIVRDGTSTPIPNAKIYVGRYEARSTPIADTNASTALPASARFVPGTYEINVQAPGYGVQRLKFVATANQNQTLKIGIGMNLASATHGARIYGNGATTGTTNRDYNLQNLIDDTESTVWSRVGVANADAIDDTTVTVDLAGDVQTVKRVKVSAVLRPADANDPGGDTGSQSRFSALRAFEIWTCNSTVKANCRDDANYTKVYTSKPGAFPGTVPRPTIPTTLIGSFDVTPSNATHVRMRVLSNQCTGNVLFQGEQDNDPTNNTDCRTAAASRSVRAAELEVYGSPTKSGAASSDVSVTVTNN